MKNALLVRGARQLLTLRGPRGPRRGEALNQLGIIVDGSVLIANGVIRDVGPARRVENLAEARGARELSAEGRVVMPGFVDSHTHLISGPPRLADFEHAEAAERLREGLDTRIILPNVGAVRKTGARALTALADGVLRGCLRHGTTVLEAKSGYGLNESGELKILRVLGSLTDQPVEVVPTFLGAHTTPAEYAGRSKEYLEWLRTSMLPKVWRRHLARFVDVCCDRGAFAATELGPLLATAANIGFRLKVHAGQFARGDGVRLAVEYGAVSVDHLAWASEEDAALLAESPVIATLVPGAPFHLGLGQYPPARMLIDRGAAVALATNYSQVSSPCYNMQTVLSLACRKLRMTPAEAISAATINGAHALRMGDRVGSLESGKQADLLILDTADYREAAHEFGVNMVRGTVKRGEVVYWTSETR